MLAWVLNMGFAGNVGKVKPPAAPVSVPGGSQRRRRGSIWEPSVAFAIQAAQEERRLARIEAAKKAHPSATQAVAIIPPTPSEEAHEHLEVLRLALRRSKEAPVRSILRQLTKEAEEALEAATHAAAATLAAAVGRRKIAEADEEAAFALMTFLMNLKD